MYIKNFLRQFFFGEKEINKFFFNFILALKGVNPAKFSPYNLALSSLLPEILQNIYLKKSLQKWK